MWGGVALDGIDCVRKGYAPFLVVAVGEERAEELFFQSQRFAPTDRFDVLFLKTMMDEREN